MAHHSTFISLAVIAAGVFPQTTAQAVSAECTDAAPSSALHAEYLNHGSLNGNLVLSLSLLQAKVSENSSIGVALRLQVLDKPMELLGDLPTGNYDIQVDDEKTGQREPYRTGYLTQISQIRLEPISSQCPSYSIVDLKERYNLRPGHYLVHASRRPSRLVSWTPYRTQALPTVVSNEAHLEITP